VNSGFSLQVISTKELTAKMQKDTIRERLAAWVRLPGENDSGRQSTPQVEFENKNQSRERPDRDLFVIGHLSFFRYSSLVIRQFALLAVALLPNGSLS
jgi:hypothetical protein